MKETGKPWVLGLSSSHNGSACLLHGDEIVAAIQEERLTRVKRGRIRGAFPSLAVQYCLQHAGIGAGDLDMIVHSVQGKASTPLSDVALNPQLQAVRNGIPVAVISHHLAHALSVFAVSGFTDAAVLVVDGLGSPESDLSADEKAAIKTPVANGWETMSLYTAEGTRVTALEKHLVENGLWITQEFLRMPRFRGLGGIFSAAAWQIFGDHLEAGKVMGLAPYGSPEFPASDFFTIVDGRFEYHDVVPARFEHADRWPRRQTEYQNLASSCQVALEEALLYLAEHLHTLCPSSNLCFAGGVALNSIANERLIRESPFANVFIVPAAEDSGCAIGAAYFGLWQLTGGNSMQRLRHDAVGRPYGAEEVGQAIARTPGITVEPATDVIGRAVDLLTSGKILGWFQGRSELGPRALGQRSILCDPRSPDAKAVLNGRVKHREAFRPFAPVVPLEDAPDWFEMEGLDPASPFMLRICRFRDDKQALVPGVVHVDGTGRLQTVTAENNGLFYHLVKEFQRRTGVPIVLNTSFNVMDEPIVETPDDALWCFLSTGLDACVFEDRIVVKRPGLRSVLDFYPYVASARLVHSRVLDRDAAAESDAYVAFSVTTPWGRTRQIASPNVLPVLAEIDGRTDGWTLLERLAAQPAMPPDEQALVASMQRWQRASQGETLIDGAFSVTEIVETVYRHRITSYDEAALTRMLIRLRRHGVIGFREAPPDNMAS